MDVVDNVDGLFDKLVNIMSKKIEQIIQYSLVWVLIILDNNFVGFVVQGLVIDEI